MGAEICDSTDEGIYEMKKPLKLIEGEPISRPCVEGQALVETLKGAAALGLKRIQVFCDFYLLYEFVTGKLLPDQQKYIDIMDQVNLLRKSFTYCEFSLILRDDVKHVFRLAREAINSQISKLETKTKSPYKEGSSSSSSSMSEEDDGEGQALVATLKGAAALGLQRIEVFVDFYLLYEFVSGKLLPNQQKCIDIMDQVNLLRKRFTYCEFSLTSRDDVKYVFCLARDAINSQISKLETKTKSPYGEGSSYSSESEDEGEVYRVYFKGLWNEERVYGSSSSYKTVTVAAMGAAICDSSDEIIHQLKTPLDLIEGEPISRPYVEGQALIVALQGAATYKLKRIEVFCDYYLLYQYVSGELLPNEQQTIDILDHVNLLRKSFTYCELSLIARYDVKYVFRLAKEAIRSQTRKAVSTLGNFGTCVICLDDISIDQFMSIGCTHRYCYSCMKQHVEVKLLNGMLPKCPHEDCGVELRIESCEKFLDPRFTEMMRQRLKEDSIPVTEKVYCPNPRCSTLMSTKEALRNLVLVYGFGARTCYNCHGNFCVYCRVPWHENITCEEYKRRNPTPLVEESKLKSLAARNLWRQCIKCKHMIELAAGCYHMTCRCGYEFCYTCGEEWKNKKATCKCPLWDEENIIDT
uniref:RBR-type E3 ubiquitin transferase n=1 Tax=Helianthus annuus TaxID=4232 RepID=A0A251SSY9_HELAN